MMLNDAESWHLCDDDDDNDDSMEFDTFDALNTI